MRGRHIGNFFVNSTSTGFDLANSGAASAGNSFLQLSLLCWRIRILIANSFTNWSNTMTKNRSSIIWKNVSSSRMVLIVSNYSNFCGCPKIASRKKDLSTTESISHILQFPVNRPVRLSGSLAFSIPAFPAFLFPSSAPTIWAVVHACLWSSLHFQRMKRGCRSGLSQRQTLILE